ncbi:MAG: Crp/Fnr family transcriptional regulator [Chitinophagales bacterium]|jgi:CRP-like cAMP-binding protein
MDTSVLLQHLSDYIELTPQEQDHFCSHLIPKKVAKRGFLLQSGQICRHSFFVHQGILRGYTLDQSGGEHLLSFAPAGWWMADLYSLFSQQPGQLFIQAMVDTEVWLLPKQAQEQLYLDIPKLERYFRILVEKSLVASQQRLIDNLSRTAEERYAQFERRFPDLVSQVPQKYIASYIGVTPEFFSKMRANWLKKGK